MSLAKVSRYNTRLDAEMASQFLNAHGIPAEVRGTREYSSHLTGSDYGSFELLVEARDLELAKHRLQQNEEGADKQKLPTSARTYLRRAVMFAFMAMIIVPVIFNVASMQSLRNFRKEEAPSVYRTISTWTVVLLQLPTFILMYLIAKMLTH